MPRRSTPRRPTRRFPTPALLVALTGLAVAGNLDRLGSLLTLLVDIGVPLFGGAWLTWLINSSGARLAEHPALRARGFWIVTGSFLLSTLFALATVASLLSTLEVGLAFDDQVRLLGGGTAGLMLLGLVMANVWTGVRLRRMVSPGTWVRVGKVEGKLVSIGPWMVRLATRGHGVRRILHRAVARRGIVPITAPVPRQAAWAFSLAYTVAPDQALLWLEEAALDVFSGQAVRVAPRLEAYESDEIRYVVEVEMAHDGDLAGAESRFQVAWLEVLAMRGLDRHGVPVLPGTRFRLAAG